MPSFHPTLHVGQTVYIIESKYRVREVTVLKISRDLITLRFTDSEGGLRVRRNRIFVSGSEALRIAEANALADRGISPFLDD